MNIKNNELDMNVSLLDEIMMTPSAQIINDRFTSEEALAAPCSGKCKGPGGCFGSY